jgi:ATP-dependent exoDNAse (exonuclease V) beta subunit
MQTETLAENKRLLYVGLTPQVHQNWRVSRCRA